VHVPVVPVTVMCLLFACIHALCMTSLFCIISGNGIDQNYAVQNPDGWALMGHVNYLKGDTENARDCYERTLSFVTDASETHSIYLRLASLYLQISEVGCFLLLQPLNALTV
jgi:hypothetical protein